MLAAFWRIMVVAILVVTSLLVGPSAQFALAGSCQSSVGPGIPAPTSLPSGIPGFHASWYGQSGYPTLCPGDKATSVVAYYNSGSQGWVQGRMGEVAYLGTWRPSPGQDQPTPLGGDGTNGSPNTGWPRYNRIAIQPAPYVGPGQVAWFQFTIQAPQTPGYYKLYLRPLIEGATWMEDYGVFWQVTVLNPDGTYPPPPPPQAFSGCREWPMELGTQLNKLPIREGTCLLQFDQVPSRCFDNVGGCFWPVNPDSAIPWTGPIIWVKPLSYPTQVATTAHEVCHDHQSRVAIDQLRDWDRTAEAQDFTVAVDEFKANYPDAWSHYQQYNISIYEFFAEACTGWYVPGFIGFQTASYPSLSRFAQKWLPK